MELKQQKGAVINYAMFRFNRTFMELKQEKAIADAQAAYEF